MVDPNTRQGKRTPVTLKIKFKSETLEQFIERYAVDVSQGGIFIRTKEPLAVGTQMKFEFQLRDASPLIAGEGTVVWTRENDPSRPAIAPGMGVRFDRLADGSQGILERILAEKAKQAPQRPTADTTKPPLFTDTPTRVAPAPMQEALLGKNNGQRGGREDGPHNDSHTPLPKPIPFHSDADEFPDEAFEEATKVRALDELIAQTAEGNAQDELAARRINGRPDGRPDPRAESAMERAETRPMGDGPEPADLPSPPEHGSLGGLGASSDRGSGSRPKLLDTSPSPRLDPPMGAPMGAPLGAPLSSPLGAPLGESPAKTRLGLEPARARVSTPPSYPPPLSLPLDPQGPQGPSIGHVVLEGPGMSSGMRAMPAELTEPARFPPTKPRSSAPLVILLLLLVAGAGAAVWFLVLRPRTTAEQEHAIPTSPTGSAATPGSAAVATGPATPGSAATPAGSAATHGETADTVISASVEGATVEIAGAGQSGPAPFTAKLEKGKAYKARISAKGYATLEVDLKGGDPNRSANLIAKPRVLSIDSDPSGAVILVDNGTTGHVTPFDIELTAAQAQKKSIRVQLRKSGYRALEKTVDLGKLAEEDTRMIGKLNEKLAVAPPITRTGGSNTGSGKGSDAAGAGSDATAPGNGSADGSAASSGPVTSPSGTPTPPPAPPPPTSGSNGSAGSAAEPEPTFDKPKN